MKTVSSWLLKGQGWANSFTTPWTATIKELCPAYMFSLYAVWTAGDLYEVMTGSALEIGLSQENVLFLNSLLFNILKLLNFRKLMKPLAEFWNKI